MSFLDSLKSGALDALHSTSNALHAQLAAALMLAGHNVTPDDHVDTLVQTATQAGAATQAAAAGQPGTVAPNYADFALATFTHSMTAALVSFAQAHLPTKFQPIVADVIDTASDVLADGKVTAGEAVDAALKVGAAVATAASPTGAAIAAVVAPLAESVAASVEKDGAGSLVDAAKGAAATAATAALTSVLGQIASNANQNGV